MLPNYLGYFSKKFLSKNFQKSPNLVTVPVTDVISRYCAWDLNLVVQDGTRRATEPTRKAPLESEMFPSKIISS